MSTDMGPSLAWPRSPTAPESLVLENATEYPLCYCLLIPAAEVRVSLLHWAVGKMVQFTHTKYLQRCQTLCWHYSHDSNNSLIFYLFFFLMSIFQSTVFYLFLGDKSVKWVISYRKPNSTPTTSILLLTLPLVIQWYGTGQRDTTRFISTVSLEQHQGPSALCAEQFKWGVEGQTPRPGKP